MGTPLKELQDSLNEVFGFRGATARAKATVALVEQRRLDKLALAKARRLAKKHGIAIERERERDATGEYWVTDPSLSEDAEDACEGNHFCVGGREVLQAVEAYVTARGAT